MTLNKIDCLLHQQLTLLPGDEYTRSHKEVMSKKLAVTSYVSQRLTGQATIYQVIEGLLLTGQEVILKLYIKMGAVNTQNMHQ